LSCQEVAETENVIVNETRAAIDRINVFMQ